MEFAISCDSLLEAGIVSSTIKKELKSLGVDRSIVRRVAIAAYESEINVVIHSHGGTAIVVLEEDYIEITFQDKGPGIPCIEDALTHGFSTASQYARENGFGAGMGLPNIKASADDFSLVSSPEGTILKIGFRLSKC
jgi:anti-sigma regulatory factor (Ser/Thr protein kinase)